MLDQDARIRLNVEKAQAVVTWLDGLPIAVSGADRGALSADLSDVYAAALAYQQVVDRLLSSTSEDLVQDIEDVLSHLEHIVWHARSARPRLARLSARLEP
jgi:hypothetical protein